MLRRTMDEFKSTIFSTVLYGLAPSVFLLLSLSLHPLPTSFMSISSDDEDIQGSLSLRDFYTRAKELHKEDQAAYVKFVLAGIDEDERIRIEVFRHSLPPDEPILVTRDYDSLLAISDHIEVDNYITVYPLAKKEETLTRNIHLRHFFHLPGVCRSIFFLIHRLTKLHSLGRLLRESSQGSESVSRVLGSTQPYFACIFPWPLRPR